jgi:hypothetical protein
MTTAISLLEQRIADLEEALKGMCYQHCGWVAGSVGGISADFLSANEYAFELLGWDPYGHPVPEMRCRQGDCMKQNTVGWKCDEHRYHSTCIDHWNEKEPHEADREVR